MRRISIFVAMCLMGVGAAVAAVRDASTVSRGTSSTMVASAARTSPASATSSGRGVAASRTTGGTSVRARTVPTRAATANANTARSATSRVRTATNTTSARKTSPASNARSATTNTIARAAATVGRGTTTARAATTKSRAAISMSAAMSNTFGTGYNACRDAYFTCMDQFCANQNESYRRCVCSSRLNEIQTKERALSQTADQIQDFKDLNIEVIPKTAAEVKAMLTASEGELAASATKDKSASTTKLAGISDVLSKAKSKSMSTAGTLDIAGDINAIWSTTDLASGASIANLTGEALYNAVHSQCAEMVIDSCESVSTLNMVVTAYGMYIENDCSTLANNLEKRRTQAQGTIRQTEREMNLARLENYDAHNATSINDCIAQVRADITADSACGKDYVHCLDVTGRYLNRDTGAPIYTADFYQLEVQVSLSGDVLTNQTNRMLVAELNNKRMFAERGLETCRDLSADVWDEFMRQAITEIYQAQQEKIRQVKNECLDVVNTCYDEQANSLKDFSNQKEQLLLGSRLALSEEMCKQKLDACSNLYGGGPNGLSELLTAMHNFTDQKIAKECRTALRDFARDMCAVPSNDNLHAYPYACRVYAPGDHIYSTIEQCNSNLTGASSSGSIWGSGGGILYQSPYTCNPAETYLWCNDGYYMANKVGLPISTPEPGNTCLKCTPDICKDDEEEEGNAEIYDCGDYIGSLYQKLVRYALQVCVRPDTYKYSLPTSVLADVNAVMDTIRVDMANELASECNRLGGYWVSTIWEDKENSQNPLLLIGDGIHDDTGHTLWKKFYNETGANTKWGYCADPDSLDEDDNNYIGGGNGGGGSGSGSGNGGGSASGNAPPEEESE